MHACDYQSRTDKPLDMRAVVFKCVIRMLAANPSWSDVGLREYCLSVYKPMGLSTEEYSKIVSWFKNHKE